MAAFYFGCQPPYGTNDTTHELVLVEHLDEVLPRPRARGSSYSGRPRTSSYPNSPWRCVQLDVGGNGYTVGDGIALATRQLQNPIIDPIGPGSMAHRRTARRQLHVQQRHLRTWRGRPTADPDDPRVIKIFIVPWGAYKNVPIGQRADRPGAPASPRSTSRPGSSTKATTRADAGEGRATRKTRRSRGRRQVGGYFIKPVDSSGAGRPERTVQRPSTSCTVA